MKAGARALLAMLVLAALTAVAAAAALAWALTTEQGTAWALAVVQDRTQGRLSVGGINGTLLRGVSLSEIAIRLPADELDIDEAVLEWDARALLGGAVVINRLRGGTVSYRRVGREAGVAEPARAFRLPLPVVVRDAVVQAVLLETGGGPQVGFGETWLTGRAAGTRLVFDELETSAYGFEAVGRGELDFSPAVRRLDAAVTWQGEAGGEYLAGSGTVTGELAALAVSHRLTAPFEVLAEGTLTAMSPPRVDLGLVWSDLALPATALPGSASGTATLAGSLAAYSFTGEGELMLDGEPLAFSVAGGGAGPRLALDALGLEGSHGALVAEGDIALDARTWDLRLEARDLDPSARFADYPGRIEGRGRLSGRAGPEPVWRLSELELAGELRAFPFAARGDVAYEAGVWRFDDLSAVSGPNHVALAGMAGDELSLSLSARGEALDVLWPGLEGTLLAEAAISGTVAEPRVRGWLEASGVALGDFRVGRLNLISDVSTGEAEALTVSLDAGGLRRGRLEVAELRARVDGASSDHAIRIEARADDWEAWLAARGGLTAWIWQGSLETLNVHEAALGEWRLAERTRVSLGSGATSVAPACVRQSGAELCGALQLLGRQDDRLELRARDFELRALDPWLPHGFGADGRYQISFSMTDFGRSPRGTVSVRGGSTAVRLVLPGQSGFETRIEEARLDAAIEDRRLTVQAGLSGRDTGAVSLTARIDDMEDPAAPLQGALSAFWSELGVLALLSPDVRDVAGTLAVELTIGGTLEAPALEGRAELNDGEIRVPDLGLHVHDIQGRATSADGSALEFVATGLVDEAQVRLTGETQLDPGASWPTRLTLQGESIPAVRLPDAEIFVTPDLDVDLRLPDIRVGGTVHVPRARVTLQELPLQAVAPSSDAVIHGAVRPEPVRPLHMRADLRLTLGEDVRYSGMNLDTAVTGEMRLTYASGRPASASGTVRMDGEYNAYGQPLGLERGELIFTGPLGDPALDVRAVRQISDATTVGVQLSGTLKSPQTRIFSNPAMSETDALAYLVFGRPLMSSAGDDTQTLQSAAIAMGLQQALPVVQRIGQSLGFDELTVRTTDQDAGALMAGKYLTPDLYVRYSYGLFNRMGGLLLRFRVNERLSLETRSSDEKSMDLLYTVEKQ